MLLLLLRSKGARCLGPRCVHPLPTANNPPLYPLTALITLITVVILIILVTSKARTLRVIGIIWGGGCSNKAKTKFIRYARTDVVLLDDVLSAVDAHVGLHIVEEVGSKAREWESAGKRDR